MSRHRQIRSIDAGEEYDGYFERYGTSVDDDYAISPSTAAQFIYSSEGRQPASLSAFLPAKPDIEEEEEEEEVEELEEQQVSCERSLNEIRSQLNETDQALLLSCLEGMRDILGDNHTEQAMAAVALENKFNLEKSLDTLLNKSCGIPMPQRQPKKRDRGDRRSKAVTPNNSTQDDTAARLPEATMQNLADSIARISFGGAAPEQHVPKTIKAGSRGTTPNGSKNATPVGSRSGSRGGTPDGYRSRSPDSNVEKSPARLKTIESVPDMSDVTVSTPATPSLTKSASKARGLDKLDMQAEYEKRKAGGKVNLNLVVIGHVDAGKSTLMGHVLYDLGQVSKRVMHKYEQESRKQGKSSFAYAWVLDETGEERQRGITMDVAQRRFETESKVIILLDAPGHKDFIPNMITGAASADVAVLVVCATKGEFETGFESGGQTREHALLVRSLGVAQIAVAVNKMDTVDWSQDRFNEITSKLSHFLKQAGFKEKDIMYVPCSGLSGQNLSISGTEPALKAWYNGPTLLECIDKFQAPERAVDKPFRLIVSDIFKGMSSGINISGRIESGSVQNGSQLLVMPVSEYATIKSIQIDEEGVQCAFAGDHVTVTLINVEQTSLSIGTVLCDPAMPIRGVQRIQARVVIFNIEIPITKGFSVVFHYKSLNEMAVIKKLISQLHKSTGEVVKKKPRCLTKQSNAVIEIHIERPICMELYKDNRDLGRFMLRYSGHTIAAGLVTEIIS